MENENTVTGQGDGLKEGKTFTQEKVNRIVQERITRDRKDRADYDEIKTKAENMASGEMVKKEKED